MESSWRSSASARAWVIARKAGSNSSGARAPTTCASTPSDRAASSTILTAGGPVVVGLAGFQRNAIRLARGTASLSNWSCLAKISRVGKALNEPLGNRIAHEQHHDGDRGRGVSYGPRCHRRHRHDHPWLETYQLGRERGEPVVLPLRKGVRDDDVLPRHPPTLTERVLERLTV